MTQCQKYKPLMMGLMDRELDPEETARINQHMIRCESCRLEYQALCETSSQLKSFSFFEPSEQELDRIWKSPFSRFTRNSGLFMVLGGWMILVIYSGIEFIRSSSEATLPKIALVGIIIGFIILLGAVFRDRLTALKTDPYKEVKR